MCDYSKATWHEAMSIPCWPCATSSVATDGKGPGIRWSAPSVSKNSKGARNAATNVRHRPFHVRRRHCGHLTLPRHPFRHRMSRAVSIQRASQQRHRCLPHPGDFDLPSLRSNSRRHRQAGCRRQSPSERRASYDRGRDDALAGRPAHHRSVRGPSDRGYKSVPHTTHGPVGSTLRAIAGQRTVKKHPHPGTPGMGMC